VPLGFCPFIGAVSETYPGACDFPVQLAQPGTQDGSSAEREFVYNASLKHDFTDDFMGYVSYGHSFRPAGVTVGITAVISDDLIQGESETSDSYEAGFKSTWMDRRLRFNGAVYHQDFENFIGRFEGVPYVDAVGTVGSGGFTYPGDAKVDGAEIELAYDFSDNWNAQLNASVTDGKYDNARVPCRDTDNDGVPDGGNNPTAADFANDVPGQSVYYCIVNDSISTVAPWSLTLQSEYEFPVMGAQGYVRGLYTYYGENDNLGPTHVADAYGLLNLYVGARSEDAGWDVSVWAKNLLDEENILTRGNTNQIYQGIFDTGYHSISYTKPREIGVTLRYAFNGG
jgi:iron complex outermembrane receptor protein